ncbi:TorF family putative porin [Flavisphingomonas formosensis]|uniref:TorF family putative porin n=1 Tax=Flavisphingomonas formosensis TaxID=861534 RepID=UPI0012F827B3|nr:TorF family putative porin [Sphingomonas formosensis]
MLKSILGLSAVALAAALATPAFADDDNLGLTINGGATVVSDYRFRGISQTNKHFAIQGTLTISHTSGFYVSTWGSSIDDYVANGSDQEIDLIAGYKKTFSGVTVDGGVLYYYYPGSGGINSDFVEPYFSVSGAIGPVTGKVGVAYAPKQHAIAWDHERDDNLYAYAELSGAIPGTPLTIGTHLGVNKGRSFLTAGLKDYVDWNVNVSYTWKNLTFGVTYVDTDAPKDRFVSFTGRDVAKAGFLGSIGVSF